MRQGRLGETARKDAEDLVSSRITGCPGRLRCQHCRSDVDHAVERQDIGDHHLRCPTEGELEGHSDWTDVSSAL